MSPAPLLVYLDTQDYINLFNRSKDDSTWSTGRQLIQLREQGKIRIGFSAAILWEFVTKPTAEHRNERVSRGRLVKEICGKTAFPYFTELKNGFEPSDNNAWLATRDKPLLDLKKLKTNFEKDFREEVDKSGLNRQARRRLLAIGRERLVADHALTPSQLRNIYGRFPLSDELIQSGVIERFFAGKASAIELRDRMTAWFHDPEEYSRIVYDYADKPNMIEALFGASKDHVELLAKTAESVRDKMRAFNLLQLRRRKELIEAGYEPQRARAMTRQLSAQEVNSKIDFSKLAESLGKDIYGHFEHYFLAVLSGSHRPKSSDILDLIHLTYAYFVDYIRCDRAMGSLFRDYKPFRANLVTDFALLPKLITDRLEQ